VNYLQILDVRVPIYPYVLLGIGQLHIKYSRIVYVLLLINSHLSTP
jgi:hypothetical protein